MSMNGVPLLGTWFTYTFGNVIVTVFDRVVTVKATTAPSGGSPLASQLGKSPLWFGTLTVVAIWSAFGPEFALMVTMVVLALSSMLPLLHFVFAAHETSDCTMSNGPVVTGVKLPD